MQSPPLVRGALRMLAASSTSFGTSSCTPAASGPVLVALLTVPSAGLNCLICFRRSRRCNRLMGTGGPRRLSHCKAAGSSLSVSQPPCVGKQHHEKRVVAHLWGLGSCPQKRQQGRHCTLSAKPLAGCALHRRVQETLATGSVAMPSVQRAASCNSLCNSASPAGLKHVLCTFDQAIDQKLAMF